MPPRLDPRAPHAPRARRAPHRLRTALAVLVLTLPAAAGGTGVTVQSVDDGHWDDPVTWDVGFEPTSSNSDVVVVQHGVVVDQDATAPELAVSGGGLVVQSGASLQTALATIGPGSLQVTGGSTAGFTFGKIGAAGGGFGALRVLDSVVFVDDLDVGHPDGTPGTLTVEGVQSAVGAFATMRLQPNGTLILHPGAPGASTIVGADDLILNAGHQVIVEPIYPAQVGDVFEIIQYGSSISGAINLVPGDGYEMDLDTDTFGVVRVEVTAVPEPPGGDTCAEATLLDPAGEVVAIDLTGSTTLDDSVPCSGLFIVSDLWFRLDNTTSLPRRYAAELTQTTGFDALVLLDACGGAVLDCSPASAAGLEFEVPAGESRLLRVATGSGGQIELNLSTRRWTDLGGGSAVGGPVLTGVGELTPGSDASIFLDGAPFPQPALAWISLAPTPFPALGGTVWAHPFINQFLFFSGGPGTLEVMTSWPAGIPSGTNIVFQFVCQEPAVPAGLVLSNGLLAVTP